MDNTLTQAKIIRTCSNLNKNHLDTVMKYLLSKNIKVSESADGSRVNLSTLSPDCLEQLHTLTKSLYNIQLSFTHSID